MTRLNDILKNSILKYGLPVLTSGIILSGCSEGECLLGKDNCKNDYGVYLYKNGSVYKGYFKNGKPDGGGILYISKGVELKGEFRDGKLVDELN